MKQFFPRFRRSAVILSLAVSMYIPSPAQVASKYPEMPSDFKSDGCTFYPDGNYHDCCVEHDKAYYFGGTIKQRKAADDDLYACVADKVGPKHKLTAQIMWLGVRLGGMSFLPTPFRWGFGNKYPLMKPRKQTADEPAKSTGR